MRVLFAILVVMSVLAFAATPAQAGGEGVIRVGFYTAEVGEQVTVVLEAADIPPPGLGAWTIDMSYDNSFVDAIGCDSRPNSACSPIFTAHTVRVTGASETGLTGTFTLATFEFRCDAAGTSELVPDVQVLATTEPIEDLDLPVSEGSITCTEPSDLITLSPLTLKVGQQGTVVVEAERVAQPGVGVWTLDVSYDSDIVSLVGCEVLDELSECSEESEGTVHVRGASAEGLQSGTVLAELEFRCVAPWRIIVRAEVEIWSVASIAVPQPPRLVDVRDSLLTCGELQLPSTGAPEPATASATVPLAVLGAALLAAAFAFRRYASLR